MIFPVGDNKLGLLISLRPMIGTGGLLSVDEACHDSLETFVECISTGEEIFLPGLYVGIGRIT